MMKNLEQNYISIVMVIHEIQKDIFSKIEKIKIELEKNFLNFEFVIVDNTLKEFDLETLNKSQVKYTYVQLPIKHKMQQALNAGIAIAIGDYIIEIEDISSDIDYTQIIELYRKSQEGYDFVFLTPKKSKITSKLFYRIINRYFINIFHENIGSSVMTLSSRRGQNKVSEVGRKVINHNVAYVLSGLKSASIPVDICYKNKRTISENILLMLDTLIYYTDAIVIFTQRIAFIFLFIFFLGIIYSLVSNFMKSYILLFLLSSLGFFGIFSILSIILRYLHHTLLNSIGVKDYIFRKIEKNRE